MFLVRFVALIGLFIVSCLVNMIISCMVTCGKSVTDSIMFGWIIGNVAVACLTLCLFITKGVI